MPTKVSAKKLCQLYQFRNNNLLFEIASQLNELCLTIPTFDTDDHDWGKDAGKFHWAYLDACQGEYPSYLSYKSVEEYLMHEIDTLMSGCHTNTSPADYYIEGGTRLLDAIFEWNGKGNLYHFYQERNNLNLKTS